MSHKKNFFRKRGGINIEITMSYFGELTPGIANGLRGIYVSDDGSKLMVDNFASSPAIYRFDMSAAFDITTASFVSTGVLSIAPFGLTFKSDGTKVYVNTIAAVDRVYEYPLSTAWDLSTIGSSSYYIVQDNNYPGCMIFSPDGTKFFRVVYSYIEEYSLSTAWDITSATLVANYANFGANYIRFLDSGNYIIYGGTSTSIKIRALSTPYDISTRSAVLSESDINLTSGDGTYGCFSTDGEHLYVSRDPNGTKKVEQYDLTITFS